MTGKTGIALMTLSTLLAAPACKNEMEGPKPCCAQPDIPPGVAKFTVVADDITGPSDGQKVVVGLAMLQATKRDQMYSPVKDSVRLRHEAHGLRAVHFEGWLLRLRVRCQGRRRSQGHRQGHPRAERPRPEV